MPAPIHFEQHTIDLANQSARHYSLSSNHDPNKTMVPAHFYGGNGFTVGTYLPLLTNLAHGNSLKSLAFTSLAMNGYWHDVPSTNKLTRIQDAKYLIKFLEKTQDHPVIGIGHSQGATATAMAAAIAPELFSELFLIEPVTFTKAQSILYELAPRAMKLRREPFKSTLKKQARWQSIDDYYRFLRGQRAFKRISDTNLRIYAEQSLIEKDGQYQLLFSPQAELASYFGTPYINDALKTLSKQDRLPFTLIVGKPSLFISDAVRQSWQKFITPNQMINLPDYGHLLPLEAPKVCANLILSHLS